MRTLQRDNINGEILAKMQRIVARMAEAYTEFVGYKDGVERVEYPEPPAPAMRAFAAALALLYKEYRLEQGEQTDRKETTERILDVVRDDHEREALKKVLDTILAEPADLPLGEGVPEA